MLTSIIYHCSPFKNQFFSFSYDWAKLKTITVRPVIFSSFNCSVVACAHTQSEAYIHRQMKQCKLLMHYATSVTHRYCVGVSHHLQWSLVCHLFMCTPFLWYLSWPCCFPFCRAGNGNFKWPLVRDCHNVLVASSFSKAHQLSWGSMKVPDSEVSFSRPSFQEQKKRVVHHPYKKGMNFI